MTADLAVHEPNILTQSGQEKCPQLVRAEARIARGLGAFYDVGDALAEILRDRLYDTDPGHAGYTTFAAYCSEQWGFGQSRARRLIYSARAVADLMSSVPMGTLPATERQARELVPVPRSQRAEVWQRAVETTPDGKPTAAHVAATAAPFVPPSPKPSPFTAELAAGLAEDGTYQDAVLLESYEAGLGALLKAAGHLRDLVRHWSPDEMAARLDDRQLRPVELVLPTLDWLRQVAEAQRRIVPVRRVK